MPRLLIAFAYLFTASADEFRTASGHPMQYYVSLPQGWTAARKWPVVVVIESANRQFQQTLGAFAKARKDMPFILVAPMGHDEWRRQLPSGGYPPLFGHP